MSSDLSRTQLFFNRLLLNHILNPNIHKIFKNNFSFNLNYYLSNEDIKYLTEIIIQSDKLSNLIIRLSDTITDEKALNKLFRKIFLKKQINSIKIYIKYLSDNLFDEFLLFLNHINTSINTLKIQMKYNNIKIKEFKTKSILENLIMNENNNINYISFIDCHFNTEQNLNLLNEYINRNRTKLKNIFIYNTPLDNNIFNIDISKINVIELVNLNLSKINYLILEKLNLSYNNISIDGIKIISNLLINSKIKKLNINKNYLGDEGCSILSKGIKQNNSLISINLSCNYIIYQGIIDMAQAINSNNKDGIYNSTIKKINFSRNSINNSAMIEFCDILKDEPENRFIKINFQYNYITDLSINSFGEFLQNFPEQTFLSLTHWININNQVNYFNYCRQLTKLKKIMIQNLIFQENTSKLFNEILLNNKKIEQLYILYNSTISPKDMLNISTGIEHNKFLSKLILTQCSIEDEGAIILSQALFNNINISHIDLDENKIGEKGTKAISEKLLGKISLKKLILSHNLINSKGALYISQSLGNAQGIQYLLLNSNKIGDEGCEYLYEGIKKNNSLIELNINKNEISNKGIKYISKALLYKENFMFLSAAENIITDIEEELYNLLSWCKNIILSGNPLIKNGIIKLLQGTENNKLYKNTRFKIIDENEIYKFKCFNNNLKEFDLSYNYLMNLSLIKNILCLKNISKLDLRSNNLGDKNISIISNYIKENSISLKILNIQSNQISSEGCKSLAEMLKNNKYLKIINLAGNSLGFKGIQYLCKSISFNNNKLEELLLNYTKCNDYCCNDIYNMLINSKSLKILSLIGNNFNNKGIDKILSSLKLNKTLKSLSIGDNKNRNNKAFFNLPSYLKFNKSLIFLDIKSSKIDTQILLKLGKSLKDNKKLVYLNLIDNNLDYQTIIKFGLLIKKNYIINDIKMLLNKPSKDEIACIKRCNPHIIF